VLLTATALRWTYKAHPSTGLDGRVGFQNEAVRESPCLSDRLGFPTMQAVPIEPQERPHPARCQIDGAPYQQVLGGPQQHRQNRRRAHDREKFKHNVGALQPIGRCMNSFSSSASDVGAFVAP
jgi:hypothetical protein